MGSSVLVMHYVKHLHFKKANIVSQIQDHYYILFFLKCQQQYPGLPYTNTISSLVSHLSRAFRPQPCFSVCLLGCNILNGFRMANTLRLCMYIGVRMCSIFVPVVCVNDVCVCGADI